MKARFHIPDFWKHGDRNLYLIDLIKKQESGLIQACDILKGIEEIAIVHLSSKDVVRHALVQKIIERYSMIEK